MPGGDWGYQSSSSNPFPKKRPRGESTHPKAKQQLLHLERRLNNEEIFPYDLKWTGCLEGCILTTYVSSTGKTLHKFLTLSD